MSTVVIEKYFFLPIDAVTVRFVAFEPTCLVNIWHKKQSTLIFNQLTDSKLYGFNVYGMNPLQQRSSVKLFYFQNILNFKMA